MNNNLVIIGAIVASPFLGALVNNYFSKRKTGAETHNLNITGEISVNEALKSDITYFRNQILELRGDIDKMQSALTVVTSENISLKARVKNLEAILKANNINYDV